MSEIKKFYLLLEVEESSSVADVKEAYRTLVKVWHPDRFGDDLSLQLKAQEKLKEINIAYEIVMQHLGRRGSPTPNDAGKQNKEESTPRPDASQQYFKCGLDSYQGANGAKDFQEAATWFRKAADLGHSEAQYYLGSLFSEGKGVTRDFAEAIRCYKFSAEQKNGAAMYRLGLIYVKGHNQMGGLKVLRQIGVADGDRVEAYKWFYLAIIYGVKEAISYLHYNTDAIPRTFNGKQEALLRASYLFPKYPRIPSGEILKPHVRQFFEVLQKGSAKYAQSDRQLYDQILARCHNMDDAGLQVTQHAYSFAVAEFLGQTQTTQLIAKNFKRLFAAESVPELLKRCGIRFVTYAAGWLPLELAFAKERALNHIWIQDIQPRFASAHS